MAGPLPASVHRQYHVNSTHPLTTSYRTHLCGALNLARVGQAVRVGGWVHRSRDLGGLTFVDLRDRAGIVQVSFDPRYCAANVCATAAALGSETVVLVAGEGVARPEAGRKPAGRRAAFAAPVSRPAAQ